MKFTQQNVGQFRDDFSKEQYNIDRLDHKKRILGKTS